MRTSASPMRLGSRPIPTLQGEVAALAREAPIMPFLASRRWSWHQSPGNPYNSPADNMMFHIVGDPYQIITPVHERALPNLGPMHYSFRHFAGMTPDGKKILNIGGLANGRLIMQSAGYALHTLDIAQDEAPVAWHTRDVQARPYGGNVNLLAGRHLLSVVEPDKGDGSRLRLPAGDYLNVQYTAMSKSNCSVSGDEAGPDMYSQTVLKRVYSALRHLEGAYGGEALYGVSATTEQVAA